MFNDKITARSVPWAIVTATACFLVLTFCGSTQAQLSGCPPGMTHYWHLDETGPPYIDAYSGDNATCSSCPTAVSGILGGALDFDGVNNHVDIPDDNTFDWSAASSFSIEFWIQSNGCSCTETGYNCNQVIIGRQSAASGGWWIGVNCQTTYGATGYLRCYFGGADFPSTTFVGDNQWHHVVFQFDNSASEYRLYVDGALDNSLSAAGQDRSGSGPISLGYFASAFQYAGNLDEIALYDSVLSLSDIQAHYNSGAGEVYCSGDQAPVVGDIPDQTIVAGTSFQTINLDDYVADPDNLDSELNWTYSGNTDLGVAIDGNHVATITPPDQNWTGSETIVFTATDPSSNFDFDNAAFTVLPAGCEPGISHYWSFEETSQPYTDAISGLDVTCTTCPTSTAGQVGNALEFNGVDQQATATDDGSFDWGVAQSFTVEFWMKSDGCACTSSGFDCNEICVGRAGISQAWWIGVNCQTGSGDEGKLRAYFGTAGDLYSSSAVADGSWHHVAYVYDAVAGEYRLYIDGALDNSKSGAGVAREGTADLQIGYYNSAPYYLYHGKLDELALYDSALDDNAAELHYQYGLSGRGFCTTGAPPVITSTAPERGFVDVEFYYDVNASGDPAPLYSLVTSPPGMVIDQNSGEISWTPASAGSVAVEVEARNGLGTSSQPFTIEVHNCPEQIDHLWNFEEVGGPVYEDFVSGYDATCTNCPGTTAGIVGNGLMFDGVGNEIGVDDYSDYSQFDINPHSSFSIEFWMKSDGVPDASQALLGRWTTSSLKYWWIFLEPNEAGDSAFISARFSSLGQTYEVSSISDVSDASWHFVTFVRSADDSLSQLYIDGDLEGESKYYTAYPNELLSIGWLNAGNRFHFSGEMDELAVYRKAIAPQEIYTHYLDGLSQLYYCAETAPLIVSQPDTAALRGMPYEYPLFCAGHPPPTYTLMSGPPGFEIDNQSGIASWLPDTTGLFEVDLEASNTAGSTSQQYFLRVNQLPQIYSSPLQDVVLGGNYSYDVESDGVPEVFFTLYEAPAGMEIDSSTGVISWSPSQPGFFPVGVIAANAVGADSQVFSVQVLDCPLTLQHYWRFESRATGFYEDSYQVSPAVCSECPATVAGLIDSATQFDGVDDVLQIADDNSFDWSGGEDFGIEFWIKTDAVSCSSEIGVLGRPAAGWWLGLNCGLSGGPAGCVIASLDGVTAFSQVDIADGQWHHVALNRSAAANYIRLYVDGTLEDHVSSIPVDLTATTPITVGGLADGGATEYFAGDLDELAIHQALISGDQIGLHYIQGLRGVGYCGGICGDADGSNSVSIGDAVFIINYIFGGGPPPVPLLGADADCSGGVSIGDAVYLINFIFGGGSAPCAACK